ncbi:MAG: FAD-dependent oxidoreductase [Dehalococcoidia bacterium]|nr:MAG: FAD-dependent oxidoreductase [Dehalococcoidia bacterium]
MNQEANKAISMHGTKTGARLLVADNSLRPPCQGACPIQQDVRGYINLIAEGEFDEALRTIRKTNPLPSVCGLICAHPCESECRRERIDHPLAIAALKRFATEYGHDDGAEPQTGVRRAEKIAIIGSGPAGLTAAHDLARMGYGVTVFERDAAPGGALTAFIPEYRLPGEVLQRDIERIVALGVEIKTNNELGKDFTLSELKNEGYSAVVLALGLPLSRGLNITGVELDGVLLALPFLREAKLGGGETIAGKKMLVIGGGNVAVDVARSALRLGAGEVHMACLEARDEMPAFAWEIEAALEEGVKLHCSKGPKSILCSETEVSGLECMEVKAVFDEEGRFNPTFYEEKVSALDGDVVIIAIGQAAELSFLSDTTIKLDGRGQLVFDLDTLATSEEGVFACGEVISGPGTAVRAMASGRQAALAVDCYLRGEQMAAPQPDGRMDVGELLATTAEEIKRLERQEMPALALGERLGNFNLIELGYTEILAVKEAQRCLRCGAGAEYLEDKCAACLTCVRVCPYGAPIATIAGSIDIRADQCQSCGICIVECPARAIIFRQGEDRQIRERVEAAVTEASLSGAEPVVIGLCCSYGAFATSAFTEFFRNSHKPGTRIVRIPCVVKIDTTHLLKAFELGADGVFVIGCLEEDCPYQMSAFWAERRVAAVKKNLDEIGLGGDRLEMYTLSDPTVQKLDEIVTGVTTRVRQLAPSPMRNRSV